MVIMFDMDGVLVDFIGGYRDIQVAQGNQPTMTKVWDDYWDKDVWRAIKSSPIFWQSLYTLVHPVCFTRINSLQATADVYFVTFREGVEVKRQTEAWLRRHGIDSPTVIVSAQKGEIAKGLNADYSIEDKAGNAVYIAYHARGCKSYLLDGDGSGDSRPCFNRFDHSVLGKHVRRVRTVDEFLDEVEHGRSN
jgi:hypothetical protein